MDSCTLLEASPQSVGMGQIVLAKRPGQLTAVLGSCVGVALYHPRIGVGALAHIVLPQASTRDCPPGKFADLAIPDMLRQLEGMGALRGGLVAKVAGGACMFGTQGPLHIGETNVAAVLRLLETAGLRVAAQEVGGSKGRRVTLHVSSGDLVVEVVGRNPIVL